MKARDMVVLLLGISTIPAWAIGQAVDCPEADKYDKEMLQLNNDWKLKEKELRAGLFCSECKRSKTEIETELKMPFAKHLTDVNGKPVPASQEVLNEAYADYLDEFEDLASAKMKARKDCDDAYMKKLAEEAERKKREEEEQKAKAEAARLAREAAEKQAAEAAAQKEKDEAERKAREEAERKAREEEERRAREEAARLAEEQARAEKEAFIQAETERLAAGSEMRQEQYDRLLDDATDQLSRLADKVIGRAAEVRSSARRLVNEGLSSVSDYIMGASLDDQFAESFDHANYVREWSSKDMLDNLIDFPAVKKALRFGQEEDIKRIKATLSEAMGEFPDLFERTARGILNDDMPDEDILGEWENLSDSIRQGICNRIQIVSLCSH